MKQLILTMLGLCCLLAAKAQAPDSTAFSFGDRYDLFRQLSAEEYLDLKLPPLHVLLENARKSPQVSFYASNKLQEERELETIRRNWLKYIKLNANYNYGMNNT